MSEAMEIKVHGIKELLRDLRLIGKKVQSDIESLVIKYTFLITREAKRNVRPRIITGDMQREIEGDVKKELGGLVGIVEAGKEYSIYQEFGTATIKPHLFMTRAFEKYEKDFLNEVNQVLERAVQ